MQEYQRERNSPHFLTCEKENMDELACWPKFAAGVLCPNEDRLLLKLKGELEALWLKLKPVEGVC